MITGASLSASFFIVAGFSRRDFVRSTVAAGLGVGILRPVRPDAGSFMSIGICEASGHADNFASYGCMYVEPGVQRMLVPGEPEEAFLTNLEAVRHAGLPTPVANQFIPGLLKVVGPEADHEAAMRFVRVALRRAGRAGVQVIVFGSGDARSVPDGFSAKEALIQFSEFLATMAPVAHDHGIVIGIEPLRSQETNFLNTVPECLEVISAVSHPAIKLTFDVYHTTQEGRGPEDVLLAGSAICHCHIAENQGRRAPGVHGEDFTPFFAALKSVGYQGRISVESRFNNRSTELPVAVRTLEAQMAQV